PETPPGPGWWTCSGWSARPTRRSPKPAATWPGHCSEPGPGFAPGGVEQPAPPTLHEPLTCHFVGTDGRYRDLFSGLPGPPRGSGYVTCGALPRVGCRAFAQGAAAGAG